MNQDSVVFVDGKQWFLFGVDYKSNDKAYCTYIYALDFEHAKTMLDGLKQTGHVYGQIEEFVEFNDKNIAPIKPKYSKYIDNYGRYPKLEKGTLIIADRRNGESFCGPIQYLSRKDFVMFGKESDIMAYSVEIK